MVHGTSYPGRQAASTADSEGLITKADDGWSLKPKRELLSADGHSRPLAAAVWHLVPWPAAVSQVTHPQGGRHGSVSASAAALSLLHPPRRSLTFPSPRVPQLMLTLMHPWPHALPRGCGAGGAAAPGDSPRAEPKRRHFPLPPGTLSRQDPPGPGSPAPAAAAAPGGAPPAAPKSPAARTPPADLFPPLSEPFSFSGDRSEIANIRGEFRLLKNKTKQNPKKERGAKRRGEELV